MIICVCNAIRDKDIEQACSTCPNSRQAEDVFAALNQTPKCGQCLCYIEDVMLPNAAPQKLA
ncbi:MAG: (2Fe-2S)-binding protein [Rickettsiales bacterium]|nr:(2Fe-2S)-binding protein [Rickettsiales bacterium]